MGEWTSLRDILQDLSVAQGCMVPACLEIYDDRPPALRIPEEESEEQTYLESGGGDIAGPDCELIQQMLNMVKDKKVSENDHEPASTSDLNPMSPEFVPEKVQNKIKRNVALSSIITAKNKEIESRRPISNDVIPTMFKRKSINTPKLNGECPSPPLPSLMSSQKKVNQYTPTSLANDYYCKYLKKSELKEELEEDIWLRAERQMKEIEARKKRKVPLLSSSEASDDSDALAILAYAYDMVNLPQHRHQLSDQCVVCSVASKHGYNF